jgi:PPOX class probable F420-dependent enzyme
MTTFHDWEEIRSELDDGDVDALAAERARTEAWASTFNPSQDRKLAHRSARGGRHPGNRPAAVVLIRPGGHVDMMVRRTNQPPAQSAPTVPGGGIGAGPLHPTYREGDNIMSVIPESHSDLLERPLFGHLATLRPDGQPQVNPMWFSWNGERLYFTNTTVRQKYKNVTAHPEVAFSINDPDQPYRYLEVRGTVERIEPDPKGEFFDTLAKRYGLVMDGPVGDAEHRVVYVVKPTSASYQ